MQISISKTLLSVTAMVVGMSLAGGSGLLAMAGMALVLGGTWGVFNSAMTHLTPESADPNVMVNIQNGRGKEPFSIAMDHNGPAQDHFRSKLEQEKSCGTCQSIPG